METGTTAEAMSEEKEREAVATSELSARLVKVETTQTFIKEKLNDMSDDIHQINKETNETMREIQKVKIDISAIKATLKWVLVLLFAIITAVFGVQIAL